MKTLEVKKGNSRVVILIGRYAVKLPRRKPTGDLSVLNQIRLGLRCNKAERKAWKEQKFPQLCPIIWSDPFGWVVVMERATPMSNAEFDAWYDSSDWLHVAFADSPFETTGKDAGTLRDGRKVMIDYGMLGY